MQTLPGSTFSTLFCELCPVFRSWGFFCCCLFLIFTIFVKDGRSKNFSVIYNFVSKFYVFIYFSKWVTFLTLISKHRPSGPMLSISRNVRLSVHVFVCLFTFEVPFNSLFAPTSQSRMSNIFRDSESLGKSNGKKWSNIWTFFVWMWFKIAAKKVFFLLILPYKTCWKPRFPID